MLNLIVGNTQLISMVPFATRASKRGRHPVLTENNLVESERTTHKAQSDSITVMISGLSQTLAALFRIPSTVRENEDRTVLYSSDPALAGLKDRL
jgi:hypothetical protein